MQAGGQVLVIPRDKVEGAGDAGVKPGSGHCRCRDAPGQRLLRVNVGRPVTQGANTGRGRGNGAMVAFDNTQDAAAWF